MSIYVKLCQRIHQTTLSYVKITWIVLNHIKWYVNTTFNYVKWKLIIPAEVPWKMHLALIDSDSLPGCLPFERQYFSTVRSPLHIPWLWTVWIDQGSFMQSLSCTLVILHSHWEKTSLHECVCLSRTKFCLIRWEGKKQLVLSDRPLWHMHIIFEFVACIPLPCTLATQGGLQLLAACIMRWSKSRTGYDIFGILDLHPSVQFPKMHSGAPAETCFLCKTHHTIWAALLLCGKSPGRDLSLWVHACITLVGFSEV